MVTVVGTLGDEAGKGRTSGYCGTVKTGEGEVTGAVMVTRCGVCEGFVIVSAVISVEI